LRELDGFPRSSTIVRELSGSKLSQFMEKCELDRTILFVLIPFLIAMEIMGGESETEEQLFAGMAATFDPDFEQIITGTRGLNSL